MLVYRQVTPPVLIFYTRVEKSTVRVECLARPRTQQWPWSGWNLGMSMAQSWRKFIPRLDAYCFLRRRDSSKKLAYPLFGSRNDLSSKLFYWRVVLMRGFIYRLLETVITDMLFCAVYFISFLSKILTSARLTKMTAVNMQLAWIQRDHLTVNATMDTMEMVVHAKVIINPMQGRVIILHNRLLNH